MLRTVLPLKSKKLAYNILLHYVLFSSTQLYVYHYFIFHIFVINNTQYIIDTKNNLNCKWNPVARHFKIFLYVHMYFNCILSYNS